MYVQCHRILQSNPLLGFFRICWWRRQYQDLWFGHRLGQQLLAYPSVKSQQSVSNNL